MKATLYCVQVEAEDGDWPYFSNRSDAFAHAREVAQFVNYDFDITKDTTADLPPKELAALLLNRKQWCADSKVVATIKGKAK